MKTEVLNFDNLDPYLLLKNGNFLYKIPYQDGWAVLKVYYGSRGTWGNIYKSFENTVFAGQSSYMPKTRLRIERECLEVWRKHGFRVYQTYDHVKVNAPQAPEGGYMLFEYRVGPKLNDYLKDESIAMETRFATYRDFLQEWSRRHDVAIAEQEPRLVHENGDGKHVMIFEEGFHWFDFEMIFRARRATAQHVSHEIVQYIWNISKSVPENMRDRIMEETVEHYPDKDRLVQSYKYFLEHPNLVHRFGRYLDRNMKQRAKKPTSKYNIAKKLKARLQS